MYVQIVMVIARFRRLLVSFPSDSNKTVTLMLTNTNVNGKPRNYISVLNSEIGTKDFKSVIALKNSNSNPIEKFS